MSRDEHMQWCKDRAMEYVGRGNLINGVASMMSDLSKHDDTKKLIAATAMLGLLAAQDAQRGDRQAVERFIIGFN